MSFQSPAHQIPRQSVVGMEGMHSKMFDPPTESPVTPDNVAPTNPVPEVMVAAGFQTAPLVAHTVNRDLMAGNRITTWDNAKDLEFFMFHDDTNPAAILGTWPGPTTRVPRGVIFHAATNGHGPPPHTIHWHGIEPTPMNDGVGHCSMEVGTYTYQFQPNFIGTYFYHCHRNTMQHFEFGLYGMLLIEPPDAYFATQLDPAIPIAACRDGKFRTAANLTGFPQFPGFNPNLLDAADPWTGDPALKFSTDPHSMTVAYDVEALWVLDDRDSVWSDLAPNARATFPAHGSIPGVNDEFQENPGTNGFFAFNQFNADYWFVTGVPVPARRGEEGTIAADVVVPPALNSGKSGMQVSINAQVGQTILLRCLNAAYNCVNIEFPVDVTVIAWDGRALGVPPYGHNEAYFVPAGTHFHMTTARRFDALIRPTSPINSFAMVEFIDTRGQVPGFEETVLMTARIPINIAPAPDGAVFTVSGTLTDEEGAPVGGATINLTGGASKTTTTNSAGKYTLEALTNGNYTVAPVIAGAVSNPPEKQFSVNRADVIELDFEVQDTFTIAGTVTNQTGASLGGVVLSLTGPVNRTMASNDAGVYSFAGLPNGDYTVTPSLTGFTFAPASTSLSINLASATGQDFVGTQTIAAFAVSGRVTDQAGAPLSGVTVTITGPTNKTVVTNADGNYTVTGLANGDYTVTPSLAGFAFTPASTSLSVNGSNLTGQDLVAAPATFSISGAVTNQSSVPIPGVTMSLVGATNTTVVTDSAGNYSFTGLANGNYTVTPSLAGAEFTPASMNLSISGSNLTGQNFVAAQGTGTFAISGTLHNQVGTHITGAVITLTGAANRTVVTDAAGNYSFTGLANGNYTVTPSLTGVTFTPASANIAISGANITGQNFVGTIGSAAFTISGRVTNQAGGNLAGVTVTLTGASSRTVVTDSSGNYSITGLSNGNYMVTPSAGSFTFAPVRIELIIAGASMTGQNFSGTQAGTGFQIRRKIWLPSIRKGEVSE